MRFSIITLGCKVNAYESQYYAEELKKRGYTQVEEHDDCDVCIINTCTVTNTAASKSRKKIHQVKRQNPNALCVVVGCFVQTASPEERDALHADLIVGANHKKDLPRLVEETVGSSQRKDVVDDITQFNDFETMPIHCFESQHRAFLKIEDGCNQFCSYCAIPYARGRERSLQANQVIQIAKQLADKGHSEIVLTGIHTGRYHDGDMDLTALLSRLLQETPDHVYYRISSIEITEVSDAFIELMKENPRICHHLHIPLQSGCDATLARMNRPYTVQEFEERLAHIRHEVPDVSISTDIIIGFVQETEEEFATTLETLERCKFSFLHVFPYSKRTGTKASTMKGEIHGGIVKERVKQVLALSDALRLEDMRRFDTLEVLIEREKDGVYLGYTNQYHPIQIESDEVLRGRIQIQYDSCTSQGYQATWKGSVVNAVK